MKPLGRLRQAWSNRKSKRESDEARLPSEVDVKGKAENSEPLPKELLWLADAPLFIDEKQVEAFYDAVLQPDYEEIGRSFGQSVRAETTIGTRLTVGAVFPPLVKAEGEASADHTRATESESGSNWDRVTNPYRRLLALVLRYATETSLHSRLLFVDDVRCVDAAGNRVDLDDVEFPRRTPRAMVMLDVQPGTKIIPAALELTGGKVVPIFKQFAKRVGKIADKPQPEYRSGSDPESVRARHEYWSWFVEFYDRQIALEVVEEAVDGGRIAWIAYRIPLHGQFPHLHLAGRGEYDTGAFGYQFLARGYRHGLRIVGTLKSEPDINVLAAFER